MHVDPVPVQHYYMSQSPSTSPKPLVSIIISSFDYAHFLPRVLDSALGQSYGNTEIIVVDDGSTDNTKEVLSSYLDRITYHRQSNAGQCAGNNAGIDLAHGQWCYFIDADDEMLPDTLECLFAQHQRDPQADFIFGGYISVRESGEERARLAAAVPDSKAETFCAHLEKRLPGLQHGGVLIRRAVLELIRYPDSLYSDTDIVFFGLVAANYRGSSIGRPVARIHAHDNRMRHRTSQVVAEGLAPVDSLFTPGLIPDELMKYRNVYLVRRLLSLARINLAARNYTQCREHLWCAIRLSPRLLLRFKVLKRLVRSYLHV